MSLTLATLLPGLLLIALGALLLISNSAIVATFKAFPRSRTAALVLFGLGAAWFLYIIWGLSEADFGDYRTALFCGFGVVAALSFFYVPDFLAVRGLSVLILLGAWPVLMSGYMVYGHPQIYVLKVFAYLAVMAAIYLGASPFRMRDFLQWMFATRERPRMVGGAFFAYGLALAGAAFTY